MTKLNKNSKLDLQFKNQIYSNKVLSETSYLFYNRC